MARRESGTAEPALLDTVALLTAHRDQGLRRGEVGTVVEELDAQNVLVEFSDDEGRAFAITPCRGAELLVLRFVPSATSI